MDDSVLASLEAAVAARPDDVPLRLHLAELLLASGRRDAALQHTALVLATDPTSAAALSLMARAVEATAGTHGSAASTGPAAEPGNGTGESDQFDWSRAEADVDGLVGPMFLDGPGGDGTAAEVPVWEPERAGLRLSDVGGMTQVKERLEASFLAPLRNPELRRLYGKSLRGGLLLYGPPGCGKTYLARAVAGELGASFLTVTLADVLDMYIGNSEKNVKELFEIARAAAPCVLFLDELDAMGQKRSQTRASGTRGSINQLLTELDGVGSDNEGIYVLAATNHPWDVDPALRRPGRLDRMLLVLPPDREARTEILRLHLRERPVEGIDLASLARRTDGFSGADLAHLCESAAEVALMDSVRTGVPRTMAMADFEAALKEVRPSIGPWLETARNVALYANQDGEYDELARHLRKRGR